MNKEIIFISDFEKDLSNVKNEKIVSKILSQINFLIEDKDLLYIKSIQYPIMELKINKYRVIFIENKNTIYIISIFLKKTSKTPKSEIEKANKYLTLILKKS